ncbi:Hpt domain-containing protein [Hufsiella ginkgonis]|uniref:Hpt domain-containing protein n=1 Tax=Hufsiella ginkgonis TaxID=2695274 RepID=A0A7K1XWK1_9SPHI|nr:Hpt domain-containing protein [Hufsiella ginkgonis]MXV15384.1 Hpt domain-containing protein [Hufsiella ginkgonis]
MFEESNNAGQGSELDLSYLNDISGGNVEFMVEMIDIFLEQTPIYFQQLSEAIQESDWKQVAEAAHKIKPTLAFMGVDHAREEMQVLEKNARMGENLGTIEPAYQSLIKTCDQLFIKLEKYKKELLSQI